MLIAIGIGSAQAQITTKEDWDKAFATKYGDPYDMNKLFSQSRFDDSQASFAWHGNYWLRAFVSMAETFDDTSYLDNAVRLIDYMLYYRDDARAARGELDILAEPYYTAPSYYIFNRDQAAPGWRRNGGQRVILTLDDGQITNGIMRFVHLVYGNSTYKAYQSKAKEYLDRVIETVEAHNELYIFDRYSGTPGSYYIPTPNGGVYSNELMYNQSATMGITLILLDDVLGGGTEYGSMAQGLAGYWVNYAKLAADGTYTWQYDLAGRYTQRIEDTSHGHIDVGFLYLAYRYGLGVTAEDMNRLAKTWMQNGYLGNGELAANVDGSGTSSQRWNAGFDWIDLTEFDPTALDIATAVYEKHYATPSWARPYLGWAEILRWTFAPPTNEEPAPTPEPTPEPTPDPEPEPTPDPGNGTFDAQSPRVAVTKPAAGSKVTAPSKVEITLEAEDNVGISQVQLYINGSLVNTFVGSGPYTHSWNIPGKPGKSHRIIAIALDSAGNSASVAIPIQAD